MDDLFRQLRSKYSGAGQQKAEGSSSPREKRISPQKSVSFKGDKKSQNWLQRQFSRQMSRSTGTEGDDYAAAVAAAAFAIFETVGTSTTPPRKTGSLSSETPPSKARSKKETAATMQKPGTISKPLLGEEPKTTTDVPLIQKRPTFAEHLWETVEDTKAEGAGLKKDPSIKKASSFSDNQFTRTGSKKPEGTSAKTKPEQLTPLKPQSAGTQSGMRSSSFRRGDSKADAWEIKELDKVKERYEKVKLTINEWESEKKKKARRKLDMKESDIEAKRAKALQSFKNEMDRINEIAGGARAQADERRRNEELKLKEKANKYRSTGKPPATCFCF